MPKTSSTRRTSPLHILSHVRRHYREWRGNQAAQVLAIPIKALSTKLFVGAALGMGAGTVLAEVTPSPLQSWAVIAGAVATVISSVAAIVVHKPKRKARRPRQPKTHTQ